MKLIDFLTVNAGRFASLTFTKKTTGESRNINFRTGVRARNEWAAPRSWDPKRRGMVVVYLGAADINYVNPGARPARDSEEYPSWAKRHDANFRNFYPESVTRVRARGQEVAVVAGEVQGS